MPRLYHMTIYHMTVKEGIYCSRESQGTKVGNHSQQWFSKEAFLFVTVTGKKVFPSLVCRNQGCYTCCSGWGVRCDPEHQIVSSGMPAVLWKHTSKDAFLSNPQCSNYFSHIYQVLPKIRVKL